MCGQQLEKMLKKLDMEQSKVHLEKGKTKLTTDLEREEVKCDFRIEKEKNKEQSESDDKNTT